MKRTALLPLSIVGAVVVGLAACPEPKDVGAIPHHQVDHASDRIEKIEIKLDGRAQDANAAQD